MQDIRYNEKFDLKSIMKMKNFYISVHDILRKAMVEDPINTNLTYKDIEIKLQYIEDIIALNTKFSNSTRETLVKYAVDIQQWIHTVGGYQAGQDLSRINIPGTILYLVFSVYEKYF